MRDISAPAMNFFLRAGNYLLLAPDLQSASFRQAELLEHLLLRNTLGKQFLSRFSDLSTHD